MRKILTLIICLLTTSILLQGQHTNIPFHSIDYHLLDRIEIKSGGVSHQIHTSLKPYSRLDAVVFAEAADTMLDAGFGRLDRLNQYYLYKNSNEWKEDRGLIESKKPFLKHFYKYKSDFFYRREGKEFVIKVNPILHLQLGSSSDTDGLRYQNQKGVEARGWIGQKVGFYTSLTDNQSSFPNFIEERIRTAGAVPGEGRFKEFNSSIGDDLFAFGHDYFNATGYITFSPIEQISLQMGHDKNFIGNGIRSLLLSDYSNDYFFLKANTKIWKFNYQNLFMQLTSQFDRGADALLPSKYAAMHHLSLNLTKWLNLGVFEAVVFQRDTGFELQYMNPLIFYRAVEFDLGSADNVLLGLDYKANFAKKFSLYGQFVLDELRFGELTSGDGWWGNKFGVQMGLKYIDVANISNLDAQFEFNTVRPYTYTHQTTQANYTHFNQPLAHPLGANFREFLGVFRYRTAKDVFMDWRLMYAQYGADIAEDNYGGNIFTTNNTRLMEFGNSLLQGNQTDVFLSHFTLSYMLKYNFFLDFHYLYRNENAALSDAATSENYLGLGMRLNFQQRKDMF